MWKLSSFLSSLLYVQNGRQLTLQCPSHLLNEKPLMPLFFQPQQQVKPSLNMLHVLLLSCVRLFVTPSGSSIHGNSPAKNTGMDGHALLQGIFLTQESNWGLLHYSWIFYQESYQGSPKSYVRLHKKRMCTLYYSSLPSSEKAMAPHSSTLAWKIPRTEEPGRLPSMGSLRVRHD